MERYIPGRLAVCAGSYMLKWMQLSKEIHNHEMKIFPGDKVNIFISIESVMKNLFMRKGIDDVTISFKQNLALEIESSILNLVAHYRAFFKKEKCEPSVYLYYTELSNVPQQMIVYNRDYRSYYQNKYLHDRQFIRTGEVLRDTILPEVKLICEYIPGCYCISSKTFDGSLIPKIIADQSDAKNVIITGDLFDTLYFFDPRFLVFYIYRTSEKLQVRTDALGVTNKIMKFESPFDLNIFNNEMYYRLLLSVQGSSIRNIRTAKRFGYMTFMKIIKDGIDKGIILQDFQSLDSIIDLFPEKYREDIKVAFQCMSIDIQYSLLSETDIDYVKEQIMDKSDPASLEALNNRRFLDNPINLTSLLS